MLRERTGEARGRPADGPVVVRLEGELDLPSAPATKRYLDSLTSGPRPDLVVDLTGVSFFDCCGIGILCRARRRALDRGGRLSLVVTDPRQLRILRKVGLEGAFEVLDTAPDGR
ncbi:STAS domain-containing protein [Streptomyces piniterrae]|uniref:Anti-sigma factor antagonist n=1 Tax=Streptomyces piniterrae TaxID=2571125 RepID=A0A4U0NW16_9ACTN|nr:STAS domain-containing protein [Streptomyces piniterrae]TJZ58966.1 STAS domain-containing protein [Streptomyces piniterrae]